MLDCGELEQPEANRQEEMNEINKLGSAMAPGARSTWTDQHTGAQPTRSHAQKVEETSAEQCANLQQSQSIYGCIVGLNSESEITGNDGSLKQIKQIYQ